MFGFLDFNPLLALDRWLSMLRWGRGVLFVVPAGTAAQTALRTLRQYGVRTYAYEPPHRRPAERGFRVRREQAAWAAYLLQRAGVPVLDGPTARSEPGPMPKAWQVPARPVGFAGVIFDFFQRF